MTAGGQVSDESLSQLRYVVGRRPASPAGALVLLHGRGTNERDLLPLLSELDPEDRLVGVTVRAPYRVGPGGYNWYTVRELGHPDPATFLATYASVSAWLDELPELTGVSYAHTVIGGFSQGAVMAYALALGRGRPSPAALVALSGFIPGVRRFELDLAAHRDVPVAIGHGTYDRVIPVEFGRAAARRLRDAGLEVEYRETAMSHSVDPMFARDLAGWLPTVLGRQRAA